MKCRFVPISGNHSVQGGAVDAVVNEPEAVKYIPIANPVFRAMSSERNLVVFVDNEKSQVDWVNTINDLQIYFITNKSTSYFPTSMGFRQMQTGPLSIPNLAKCASMRMGNKFPGTDEFLESRPKNFKSSEVPPHKVASLKAKSTTVLPEIIKEIIDSPAACFALAIDSQGRRSSAYGNGNSRNSFESGNADRNVDAARRAATSDRLQAQDSSGYRSMTRPAATNSC